MITVSHTFFATVGAIVRTGATPVLDRHRSGELDDEPGAGCGRDQRADESDRAGAHLRPSGGRACNRRGGARDPDRRGRRPGPPRPLPRAARSAADAAAACFSFYPGKNLGAYGDAGAVITDDPLIAERIRALRDHGRARGAKYEHDRMGMNARAAELQMAVLRAKLPHLPQWTLARRQLSERYERQLAGRLRAAGRAAMGGACTAPVRAAASRTRPPAERTAMSRGSAPASTTRFPATCSRHSKGRWRGGGEAGLLVSEAVAASCLSLPLYPELGEDGVDTVVAALSEVLLEAAA